MAKVYPSPQAIAGFTSAVTNLGLTFGDKLLGAEERMQFNAGMEAIDQRLTNFDSLLKQDPNWQGYLDKAALEEEKIWDELDPTITNQAAKNQLYAYMQQKKSQHLAKLSDYQTQQRIAEAIGTGNATLASIMSDPSTPSEIRKQKVAAVLADMYETNIIDNPTKGAKEEELFHKIDLQTVSGAVWNEYTAGRDWEAYLANPENQMGLQATEIDKINDAVWGRVQQDRVEREQKEKEINTIADKKAGTAYQNLITNKGKPEERLSWDYITNLNGEVIGAGGRIVWEQWMGIYKEYLDAAARAKAGGGVDFSSLAPYLPMIYSTTISDWEKSVKLLQAHAAGKFGPPQSDDSVRVLDHAMSSMKFSDQTRADQLKEVATWGRINAFTGDEPLMSAEDSAAAMGILNDAIRINPEIDPMAVGKLVDDLKARFTKKDRDRKIDRVLVEPSGLFGWGPVVPSLKAVDKYLDELASGKQKSLEGTTQQKKDFEVVESTLRADLEKRFAKPQRVGDKDVQFIIQPKTAVAKGEKETYTAAPNFLDQFGTVYFYGHPNPKEPKKWGWAYRLFQGKNRQGKNTWGPVAALP